MTGSRRGGPLPFRLVPPRCLAILLFGSALVAPVEAGEASGGLRLPDGRYVLVSNPQPKRRAPRTLAVSRDGLVFTAMGYLVGGRHVDYPHVIHQAGQLFIAFATAKQTGEVLRLPVAEVDRLERLSGAQAAP